MKKLADISLFQALQNSQSKSDNGVVTEDMALALQQSIEDSILQQKHDEQARNNPWNYMRHPAPIIKRKVYDHGKGVNIPPEKVVRRAKDCTGLEKLDS